jgi:BirA family biotin operon repressor/biotin-[acetyl-CoA-carboxylase] ligase
VTPLDLELLARTLATRQLGRRFRYLASIGSTNDVALEAASSGGAAEHGLLVIAEEQTCGRGRSGSVWTAPRGTALLFSVVLVVPLPAADAARLTLAASVAVCGALREAELRGAHIKWPNDVLVATRKVAGILCETRPCASGPQAVVVGIGIDVNQAAAELPAGATSVRVETGREASRELLLAATLLRLEAEHARVAAGAFADVQRAWEAMSPLARGHRVRATLGEREVEGISDGLGASGALRVRRDDGTIAEVMAGSVAFS